MSELAEKLLSSLQIVRSEFDKDSDDWRFRLVRTIKFFLHEGGIDPALIVPIQQLELELAEEIYKVRRVKAGVTGTPMPLTKSVTLAFASAAVTALKERTEYSTITESIDAVCRAIGHDRKKLRVFRDNLNRGLLNQEIAQAYEENLSEIRTWPTAEIFVVLNGMASFVK